MKLTNTNHTTPYPASTDCPLLNSHSDVQRHIFAQLEVPQDFHNLGRTCRHFAQLMQDPAVQRTHRAKLSETILKRSSVPIKVLDALETPALQQHWYAQQAAAANLGKHPAKEVARYTLSDYFVASACDVSPCDRWLGVAGHGGWALFSRTASTLQGIVAGHDDSDAVAFSPCSTYMALMGKQAISLVPLQHNKPRITLPFDNALSAVYQKLFFTADGRTLAAYTYERASSNYQLAVWQNWSETQSCQKIISQRGADSYFGLSFFESAAGRQLNLLRQEKQLTAMSSWELPSGKACTPPGDADLCLPTTYAYAAKLGVELRPYSSSKVYAHFDGKPQVSKLVYDFEAEGRARLAGFSRCGTQVFCILNQRTVVMLSLAQADLFDAAAPQRA